LPIPSKVLSENYKAANQIEDLINKEMQMLIKRDVTRREFDFDVTPEQLEEARRMIEDAV
jgi:hypothetical protein